MKRFRKSKKRTKRYEKNLNSVKSSQSVINNNLLFVRNIQEKMQKI